MKEKVYNSKSFELLCKNLKVKEVQSDGETVLQIQGYANTTEKDRQGDVVLSEAWLKGGLDNYLKNPIVLYLHKPDEPIGQVTEYTVDNNGLHVVAEISKLAGKVYDLIKGGILKAFSVGFRVKDADYNQETDIFIIKDLEMYELSVVSVPANASSIFSIRKSFENESDYLNFKQQYVKQEASVEEEEVPKARKPVIRSEKKRMEDDTLSLTKEELEAAKTKAVEDALAKIASEKAADEAMKAAAITAGKSGAEELIKEIETRFTKQYEDEKLSNKELLDGLRAEVQDKAKELEAITRSKMQFENRGNRTVKIEQETVDKAVLTAKILGVPVETTKFYKDIVEKTGAHLASLGGLDGSSPEDWENEFSTRLYEDIKAKTIIEPLIGNRIQMSSRTMTFPWNPDAGYAEWVADTAYKSTDGTSTGTAAGQTHLIKDAVITAQKLASKEFLGYEEEEDTILPLVPIIRDAVMRRMIRSTDTEILRGNVGADTGSGTGLINGFTTIATDNSVAYTQTGTFGTANPVTIADLQQVRKATGAYGLMPGDGVYIVSQSVYYDLLDDPDFRTMDLVGPNATILRGQIGMVNGSAVLVSDSFVTNAASTVQAAYFNATNYLFGELRGVLVERFRDVINQKNVLIATRRFAFNEIVPGSVSGHHSAAALVTAGA